MKRFLLVMLMFLSALLLCGCGGKDKYEPFTELSKQTVSPERESAIQAALNGNLPTPTEVIILVPTEVPTLVPTFDENSFFAEVGGDTSYPADEQPFEPDPTATPWIPTETPLPTATKPYDPNIMMYGSTNGLTTYTIQEGEFLICLARRFDVSLSQLMAQNGISSPDELGVGDTVILPRSPNPWSMLDGYGRRTLIIHPAQYVTKEGDNLFSIACAYGDVRPEDIARRNQLVLGEPLTPGITIIIP